MGRFLNDDIIYDTDAGLQGYNLFIYCGNNPINRIDSSGTDSIDNIDGDKEDENYHDHSGGHGKPSPAPGFIAGSPTKDNGGSIGKDKQQITIPDNAWATKDYVNTHNGTPPQGYKGGREFANDGRNGGQILPVDDAPYHEYDIYPHIPGVNRGSERIVIGSSGTAWYTNDHYRTFVLMV